MQKKLFCGGNLLDLSNVKVIFEEIILFQFPNHMYIPQYGGFAAYVFVSGKKEKVEDEKIIF